MKTYNLEANMKTQDYFNRSIDQSSRCGREAAAGTRREASRAVTSAASLLLGLACLALPGRVVAQPANYTDPTVVANYVKGMLYWPNADPTTRSNAAFRYKHLLYTDAGGLSPVLTNMVNLYGAPERARAQTAETYLRYGLTNNPASTLLGGLLLDLYYDRAAAEFILAANPLTGADRARMGPPSVPTGLVIDDEIALYQQALGAYRSALMTNFALLSNSLGMTNVPPAGYQWFRQLVPARSLEPASYLSNGVPASVSGDTNVLFTGYKDLVLIFNGLRDYGRAAAPLARLQWARNNPGDPDAARSLIADSQRFLFLQTSTLLALFPGLDPYDTNVVDQASGLAEALDGVSESQGELEAMRQTILSGAGLLGFADDFLMLVQKFAGQSGNVFDSFDSFQLQLDPANLSSPLAYAQSLLTAERNSYDEYRGSLDQLDLQLQYVPESARNRLVQIAGAQPGTPEYAHPENNVGSEIWQQVQSIKVAQLRIKKNQVQMDDLNEEVQIEVQRAAAVSNVTIRFADKEASLDRWIGHINAAQAAAEAAAKAFDSLDPWGAGANAVNAVVQAGCEEAKGQLEAKKAEDAGLEQATIEGINSAADIKTKLLGMNTLVVDSEEAAVLLAQEMGRLVGLLREKANLEGVIAECRQDLAGRYFADPIHHLRYQHQTMLAHLAFDEAQKWLYFMVRALEYKWNTPFMNYSYMGRSWSTSTLFKLRNAEELAEFYNAMVSFNSLVQLPADDYWDWFSVREDFFGYKLYDATGTNLMYYADPANPNGPANLTAIQAFRQRLKGLTNSLGTITLNFSTVREIPGGTFFRGPRFDTNLQTVLSAGLFLDKIKWIKINLPGSHSLGRSTLAGQLTYGGNSFIRNFDVGSFVPGRPDRMTNELTAYSTRYWFFHAPSASWEFSEALQSPVTMTLTNDSRMPPSVGEIDIFNERSVATSGWVLSIPTQDLGVPVMRIDELNDVELYFYHYAVSRQVPEGMATTMGEKLVPRALPFPYYLKYQTNSEDVGN